MSDKNSYFRKSVVKTDKKSSQVDSGKDSFWVVIGCGNGLLSSIIDNLVEDVNDLSDSELKDRVDRFYDKERAFEFAKTLALKTPGESYYVLESVAHVVIAPAQVEFNPY